LYRFPRVNPGSLLPRLSKSRPHLRWRRDEEKFIHPRVNPWYSVFDHIKCPLHGTNALYLVWSFVPSLNILGFFLISLSKSCATRLRNEDNRDEKLFTLENQLIVDEIELSACRLMWGLEFTRKLEYYKNLQL
jgi:hypothetical protein